jgi:hypothetical protein
VWLFVDAKRRAERGSPVAVSFGAFTLSSPSEWLVACIVGWIVVLPVYVTARGSAFPD